MKEGQKFIGKDISIKLRTELEDGWLIELSDGVSTIITPMGSLTLGVLTASMILHTDELQQLREWKAGAMEVSTEWHLCYEEIKRITGREPQIGQSIALWCLKELQKL